MYKQCVLRSGAWVHVVRLTVDLPRLRLVVKDKCQHPAVRHADGGYARLLQQLSARALLIYSLPHSQLYMNLHNRSPTSRAAACLMLSPASTCEAVQTSGKNTAANP